MNALDLLAGIEFLPYEDPQEEIRQISKEIFCIHCLYKRSFYGVQDEAILWQSTHRDCYALLSVIEPWKQNVRVLTQQMKDLEQSYEQMLAIKPPGDSAPPSDEDLFFTEIKRAESLHSSLHKHTLFLEESKVKWSHLIEQCGQALAEMQTQYDREKEKIEKERQKRLEEARAPPPPVLPPPSRAFPAAVPIMRPPLPPPPRAFPAAVPIMRPALAPAHNRILGVVFIALGATVILSSVALIGLFKLGSSSILLIMRICALAIGLLAQGYVWYWEE